MINTANPATDWNNKTVSKKNIQILLKFAALLGEEDKVFRKRLLKIYNSSCSFVDLISNREEGVLKQVKEMISKIDFFPPTPPPPQPKVPSFLK